MSTASREAEQNETAGSFPACENRKTDNYTKQALKYAQLIQHLN